MPTKYPYFDKQKIRMWSGKSGQKNTGHISNLKNAGKLRRVGLDKGGHWDVIA